MIRKCFSIALAALFVLWTQIPARADEIVVAAAASLGDALKQISEAYRARGGSKVQFSWGSSSALARQIERGAPVDIFFSADRAQMDSLEKKDRLEPGTRKNLLSNQLVLIVPADSRLAVHSPEDLLKPEVKRIAVAEPTAVPVGVYASRYLQEKSLWDRIEPKIVPVLDARATLASVESANVDAGFVYKTDAAVSKRARVVYEVPVEKGPKIVYPAAIIKDSKKKAAARDFLTFVLSDAGKGLFRKHGFLILE